MAGVLDVRSRRARVTVRSQRTAAARSWSTLTLVGCSVAAALGLAPQIARPAASEPTGDVRVIAEPIPPLHVLRTTIIYVRIVNESSQGIPGCTAADSALGKTCLFLGGWTSRAKPKTLGLFENTVRLEQPIPPGGAFETHVAIKPGRVDSRFVGLGLFRVSRSPEGSGQVGLVTAVPVSIAPGSWADNHRALLLHGLFWTHGVALVAGAALAVGAALVARRSRS